MSAPRTLSPVKPPRIYFVACDTGVKRMLVDAVEYGGGKPYFVRGKVYSANTGSWSLSPRWRAPVDGTCHGSEKGAREAWKAWKAGGGRIARP